MSEFDKKISQLTGGSASQATDEYVINRGGANYKITGANVAAAATAVGTLAGLTMTGNLTLDTDVVVSRGAANRLDLASGDSLNLVSGTYKIGGTDVLSSNTLGSGVTASSLTSVGTLTSLTVSGDLTVDTSTLKVDSSGNRVLIGTTTARAISGQTNKLQVVDVGGVTGGTSMFYYSADGGYNFLSFGKSRGATDGSFTVVQNNDALGAITFAGADGSAFASAATITARVDGTPGAGDMPGRLVFSTTADGASSPTDRMTLDSSGNLGLGVTPSAWGSTFKPIQLGQSTYISGRTNANALYVGTNGYWDGSADKYIANGFASSYEQGNGVHTWKTAASGTAGGSITYTTAMTLDASGQLGIGTASPASELHVKAGSGFAELYVQGASSTSGMYLFDNNTEAGLWKVDSGYLAFATNNTERARINSGGYFKASNNGTYLGSTADYHELRNTIAGNSTVVMQNTSATGYGPSSFVANEGTTYWGFRVYSSSADRDNCYIWSNGDLQNRNNSYTGISDAKLKENIVDAESQWDDIKNIRVRKFQFIGDELTQIGVVAQEIETVSPGLVYETPDFADQEVTLDDGEVKTQYLPTGTTSKSVKYSVLYMKSVKALQEAMARIEALEARLEALEA